nr:MULTISPECIES: hypothetical protein [Myxococcaceae]
MELRPDASGFVRRECPRCRRHFKTRPSPSDAGVLQRALCALSPFEVEERSASGDAHGACAPERSCLYCGHRAGAEAWLTEEQQAHLEALARAWGDHVRYEQLAHVARTLAQNPRPTFIAVPPAELPGPMPAEPDDMRVLPLLCCGEDVKALWDWDEPLFCPRCGARHSGVAGRSRVELQFIEE